MITGASGTPEAPADFRSAGSGPVTRNIQETRPLDQTTEETILTLRCPASLREKYRLGKGDPLTVVDLDGAVLLSPLRRARKLSLKDLGRPARED